MKRVAIVSSMGVSGEVVTVQGTLRSNVDRRGPFMKPPSPFVGSARVTNETQASPSREVELSGLSEDAARFPCVGAWAVGDAVELELDARFIDRDFGVIVAKAEVASVDEQGVLLRLEDLGDYLRNGIACGVREASGEAADRG